MVEIIVTDVFEDWFDKLSEKDSDAVTKSVDRLEDFGVSLGFPYIGILNETCKLIVRIGRR